MSRTCVRNALGVLRQYYYKLKYKSRISVDGFRCFFGKGSHVNIRKCNSSPRTWGILQGILYFVLYQWGN